MSIVLLSVALLVILMVVGVPVALALAASVILLVTPGDYGSPIFLIPAGLGKIYSIILVALPRYILAGNLMIHGGLARRLVVLAESLVGRVRGGMGLVVSFAIDRKSVVQG